MKNIIQLITTLISKAQSFITSLFWKNKVEEIVTNIEENLKEVANIIEHEVKEMLHETKHHHNPYNEWYNSKNHQEPKILQQEQQETCDKYSPNIIELIKQEGLYSYSFKHNQQRAANQLATNLMTPKGYINKIPYLVHHVWLTHPNHPKEISKYDIDTTIATKKLFAQDHDLWHHIIWTNDLSLIPSSVKTLEANGIEVRSMQDYKDGIRLFDEINILIENKNWGVASDTLRYNIMESFGGVYSDLNFAFKRSVYNEVHKYDFFAQSLINCFFAAKPHHPITKKMVDLVEHNLNNPETHITNIDNHDKFVKTFFISFLPLSIAYIKNANQAGNIDIIYPATNTDFQLEHDKWLDPGRKCVFYWEICRYPNSLDLCGAPSLLIGKDGGNDDVHLTWLEE